MPLLGGLAKCFNNRKAVLKEILAWTNGQPFLTQKLCQLVVREAEESQKSKVNNYSPHLPPLLSR
jgi:hypothetical protein